MKQTDEHLRFRIRFNEEIFVSSRSALENTKSTHLILNRLKAGIEKIVGKDATESIRLWDIEGLVFRITNDYVEMEGSIQNPLLTTYSTFKENK